MTYSLAVERPWRQAWPLVAQTDDSNRWVTGSCWLYCRREGVRVLWVGSVSTPGATGDVYACGPCLAELDHIVRVQAHGRDRGNGERAHSAAFTVPPLLTAGPGACEHWQIEKRDGKTYCRACERQLYL
ncbi:hypothetical protein [Streptomyces axinellae]|uniref:Uncharacterized protein n=1 Tax=Streptomyces axinellae TaxID=552788 RepID=A0ABN3QUI3_9ACTN